MIGRDNKEYLGSRFKEADQAEAMAAEFDDFARTTNSPGRAKIEALVVFQAGNGVQQEQTLTLRGALSRL
ncbi:hypothetical protein [Mesorhizobium sp. CA4]|uniref:hypothetical protein n=1 Tax=Mesorhizobium sp. CA4 TaxID=588499 RepID=UPI001CD12242|nr:hypothetical protein [Mesorhizobium sp. CA4]MBZ9823206.1 hypothetical protein [Mesorhizobium sp. CA4]